MGKPSSKQLDPGLLSTAAHASLSHAGIPGVGGGVTVLSGATGSLGGSATVPAGTVTTAGESIKFAVGYTNPSQNNSINISFGGQNVLSTNIGNGSSDFESWLVELIYLGSNTWYYSTKGQSGQALNSGGAGTITVNPASAQSISYSIGTSGSWSVAAGNVATV